jgi:hypothetical protein
VATRQNPFAPGAHYVPPQSIEPIRTAKPSVRFLSQAVQPPSQVYVESTDVLRVAAASSQAGESLTVSYRLLLPNGEIVMGQSATTVTSDRALNIHDEPLAEGFLLSVSCKAAAATTRGQTFARIFLTDPVLGAGQPSYMLMADYVTTRMAPAHPNGRVLAPSEGPGFMRSILVANPPPATDWLLTVPTNARWRPTSAISVLTNDANVGNRTVAALVGVNGSSTFLSAATENHPANQQSQFTFSAGLSFVVPVAGAFQLPWPANHFLVSATAGYMQAFTTGYQAGDQWSAIRVCVEEWLDNV